MTKKKYRSILAVHLSIGITVNGKPTTIDFDGGANGLQRILPYYITSNPDIQAALESSSGFNQYYRLETVETTPDEVVKPITPEVPSDGENSKPAETPVPPVVEPIGGTTTPEVPDVFGATEETGFTAAEVTNAQDAKAYLNEKFPGQVGQMPNKAAVLSEANRLKVSFPNWK